MFSAPILCFCFPRTSLHHTKVLKKPVNNSMLMPGQTVLALHVTMAGNTALQSLDPQPRTAKSQVNAQRSALSLIFRGMHCLPPLGLKEAVLRLSNLQRPTRLLCLIRLHGFGAETDLSLCVPCPTYKSNSPSDHIACTGGSTSGRCAARQAGVFFGGSSLRVAVCVLGQAPSRIGMQPCVSFWLPAPESWPSKGIHLQLASFFRPQQPNSSPVLQAWQTY